MTTPLLTTKLYLPTPRLNLVPRPRQIESLNAGLSDKLTLISVPAGFGKSTLLSAWVEQAEPRTRVVWLSLDAGDIDLTYFLTHCVAALQTIKEISGREHRLPCNPLGR
jgi:LuxR family maltose regulon positive regulatory protein